MDINAALSQMTARVDELAITSPSAQSVRKVWTYGVPANFTVADLPAAVFLVSGARVSFGSAIRTATFEVNIRLLVHDANLTKAQQSAYAFLPQIGDKLAANIKLGLSGWHIGELRADGELFRVFDEYSESGRTIGGLDLFLDLVWKGSSNNQPGSAPA